MDFEINPRTRLTEAGGVMFRVSFASYYYVSLKCRNIKMNMFLALIDFILYVWMELRKAVDWHAR